MNESIESQVISIIANELNLESSQIEIGHSLEWLRADELDVIEICMALEERFGLKSIPMDVYKTFQTVSDIVQCVEGMVEKEIQKSPLTTPVQSVPIHPMNFTDTQVTQRTFHVTTKEMLSTYLDFIKSNIWDEDDVTGKIEFTEDQHLLKRKMVELAEWAADKRVIYISSDGIFRSAQRKMYLSGTPGSEDFRIFEICRLFRETLQYLLSAAAYVRDEHWYYQLRPHLRFNFKHNLTNTGQAT